MSQTEMTLIEIDLATLDLQDDSWRFTLGNPSSALLESIRAVGCLCPPLVVRQANSETRAVWLPIAGFKRLQALQASGVSRIAVWDVSSLDDFGRVVAAGRDASRDGELSPFACARAITLAQRTGASADAIAAELLPSLGLAPHRAVMKRYLKLSRIPRPLQDLLEEKGLSIKRAIDFAGVSEEDGELLVGIARHLGLSARALEEWTGMLRQSAERDGKSWAQAFEDAGCAEVLRNPKWASPEKTRRIRRLLWQLRYPRWATQQDRVEEALASLELPPDASVQWDERFEQEGFRLTLQVRTTDEFSNALDKLSQPDTVSKIRSLLALL
ncbi:MAG: ParB/RepB/Spo0J family partition protein [Myxococcales bacterium]|nr:ParB/RepB/Spo0J family partition protein [Myxococcales bacterium]